MTEHTNLNEEHTPYCFFLAAWFFFCGFAAAQEPPAAATRPEMSYSVPDRIAEACIAGGPQLQTDGCGGACERSRRSGLQPRTIR